jgi:glycine/D-amino acid oxidase-like deaminating enzyme
MSVSERDSDGWITVKTNRGVVRARAIIHTTNRWASHLLPEFEKLVLPMKSTVAALKAPAGFIKHTGAQHWDTQVNVRFLSTPQHHVLELTLFVQNYHIQLPPPYNVVILGGARAVLVHKPDECYNRDNDDLQFEGVPEFMRSWPESDVLSWDKSQPAELARDANDGGCWTGSEFDSSQKVLRSAFCLQY